MIPGLELTYDDPIRSLPAMRWRSGYGRFLDVSAGLDVALAAARAHGAALVAAHPYSPEQLAGATRVTAAFAARPELAELVDLLRALQPPHAVRLGSAAGHATARPAYLVRLEHDLRAAA